jgi:hypothetical protein
MAGQQEKKKAVLALLRLFKKKSSPIIFSVLSGVRC